MSMRGFVMVPSSGFHRHLDFRPGDRTRLGLDATRRALSDWRLETAATDALLIAGELLANAARHTPGPLSLDLDLYHATATGGDSTGGDSTGGGGGGDEGRIGGGRGGGIFRITVTDPLPDPPRPIPHRPERPYGHGLHIVQRLSTAWGHHPCAEGKQVWAELPAAILPQQ